MASILLVGNAVLDLINTVDHYPAEDEEMRAEAQTVRAGGNAANTAQILAQLGHKAELLALLAQDRDGDEFAARLAAAGVQLAHIVRRPGHTPVSYITHNRASGSRTIVHHRDLPELSAADFPLEAALQSDWVHFEGRNVAALQAMMAALKSAGYGGGISLEAEKPRPGLERLFGLADAVMASRPYAQASGFDSAQAFLSAQADAPAVFTCTWGAAGAWARTAQGGLCHSPAFPPPQVRDTVGAGDAFNAGLIDSLVSDRAAQPALTKACRIASRKIAGDFGLR